MLLLFQQLLLGAGSVNPPAVEPVAVIGGGGGGGGGDDWLHDDGETHRKNSQLVNIVAAMVTSGILSCH